MDIVQKEVAALAPYANNTKSHPEDQVARIAASMASRVLPGDNSRAWQ